jgi:hypothetical protein
MILNRVISDSCKSKMVYKSFSDLIGVDIKPTQHGMKLLITDVCLSPWKWLFFSLEHLSLLDICKQHVHFLQLKLCLPKKLLLPQVVFGKERIIFMRIYHRN